ncbi:modular serine protease-like [Drosophila kikkawai]|uniref:Modular serine protease-like n=1 Tax=Drosophila kikkawai TaxID=30033 RepID=A0A6P4I4N1_DROKI
MSSRSVVAVLILILAFGYSEKCSDEEHQCVEDDSCISLNDICDLKPDCPNGSDESFTVCKGSNTEHEETHCANGAEVTSPRFFCNRIVDCLDGTDELPKLCANNEWLSRYRGNCADEDSIECLPGECVPEYKLCNHEIDCSNGLDESLEFCIEECIGCFRCGNGQILDKDSLCNNHMDCLDGTDELPSVCKGTENWVAVEPKVCYEPQDRKFTKNTKFIESHSKRFVYANQPAEMECWNSNQISWNVCKNDGSWHHELPSCKPIRINLDPDTNGTNGCPINYYDSETMKILGHKKTVLPPLNNLKVKFECREGYEFLPYHLSGNTIRCKDNKQWSIKDFHPRCVKLCPPEQINGMYTLEPKCFNGDSFVSCKDEKSLIPGTLVKFDCYPGSTHKTAVRPNVTCSEDGTWNGLKELCRAQNEICHFDCNSRLNHVVQPMMKDASPTSTLEAHWVVPILLRNTTTNNFDFKCTGNLIRLDMVLTSAHCISKFENATADVSVGITGNLSITAKRVPVKRIFVYPPYDPITHKYDVGIIVLKERMERQQNQAVICLPYDYENQPLNESDATVFAWEDNRFSKVIGEISGYIDGDFNVTLKGNSKMCQGDSGSGVTVKCGDTRCIVGVISRTEGPGEYVTKCKQMLTATNISPLYIQEFINETISTIMNCPN